MSYLVTGVAGFIGSHLAEALLDAGGTVVGVDCFTEYYPKSTKFANIAEIIQREGFRFIEVNLGEADLSKLLNDVEFILHLAAQPGVRPSWGKFFDNYIKDNVIATQRLLEAAKNNKAIKKFIFVSSSSVYGDSEKLPTPEETNPIPVSPYGATKLMGENLCHVYFRNYGLPTVILRYFTVYGPRQRPDMAFNRFIDRISRGKEIEIYGDGEQTRDFTYVGDIVAGTKLALEAKPGTTYNIGSGNKVSLNEAISIIESLLGKKGIVVKKEDARGDVRSTAADISKARKDLGYSPKTRISEGLKEQVLWQLGMKDKEIEEVQH